MNANDISSPGALVTCPKCSKGNLPQFAHVEGGVCFLCDGAAEVTAQEASRWLASQMGRDSTTATVQNTADRRPTKTVEIDGLGLVTINRFDDGSLNVSLPCGLWLVVKVSGGRVAIDDGLICNGLLGKTRPILNALNSALRR